MRISKSRPIRAVFSWPFHFVFDTKKAPVETSALTEYAIYKKISEEEYHTKSCDFNIFGHFGFTWRRGWDSNPRAPEDKLISSQPRYDHFDTSP